jgi:hypothetical protein
LGHNAFMTKKSSNGPRTTIADILVLVAATSLSLAGLRSDDILTVFLSLFVSVCCFGYFLVSKCTRNLSKITSVIAVLLVFSAFSLRFYRRIIAGERSDIYNHLSLSMGPLTQSDESGMHLLYTVRNDSGVDVTNYRTSCLINRVMEESHGGIIEKKPTFGSWQGALKAGGDGRTDACFLEFFKLPSPAVCLDLTVTADYLADHGISDHKSMRFVTAKGNGPQWYPVAVDYPGNYCDGGLRSNSQPGL